MTPCGVGAHLHFATIPRATLACGTAPPHQCTPPALACSLSAPTLAHTSQRWPPDHLTGRDPSDPGRNYHIHHPMWHDPGYHQSHHGPGPQESSGHTPSRYHALETMGQAFLALWPPTLPQSTTVASGSSLPLCKAAHGIPHAHGTPTY